MRTFGSIRSSPSLEIPSTPPGICVSVFVAPSILINPSLVCSTFRTVKKIGMKMTRELLDFPQDKDA